MKTQQIFFEEEQRQDQKWIAYLVIFLLLLNIYGIFQQLVLKIPFGSNPLPDNMLFLLLVVPVGLFILMKLNILLTRIDGRGISFRYKPWHRTFRQINWDEIDKCYVRVYSPIKEYGGWGLRTAFTHGNGKAYNVSGRYGLQLELKNGSRILIGTNQPEKLSEALKNLNP